MKNRLAYLIEKMNEFCKRRIAKAFNIWHGGKALSDFNKKARAIHTITHLENLRVKVFFKYWK